MRIAIIGGGIFGIASSIILAKNHQVELFEKNSELLQSASGSNQFRVHRGYHYPRSPDTVKDIIQSENSFKEIFSDAVLTNFEHHYELANFYKDNEFYEKSIKYYSLALKGIEKDHFLVPKILDRRGTSFERLGNWENAEKDLMESLKILPDQPHVLNYLAYSWIDKGINLDKGLEMLKKAVKLKKDDGYIIDSLGWAYYVKKNYIEAAFFLQKAVELLPSDPIVGISVVLPYQ